MSDNKIGRPRSGSPICLSRVWLQTKLDDSKSYYQLIIKITISEKRRIPRYDKGKFALKVFTLFLWRLKAIETKVVIGWMWLAYCNSSLTPVARGTFQRRYFFVRLFPGSSAMTDKPSKRVKIIPFCSIPLNKGINKQASIVWLACRFDFAVRIVSVSLR